jgi:phosphoribosylformylglycinamidine synthase
MKQRYPNDEVIAPGTVIISAGANCSNINQIVEPVLKHNGGNIYYINLSQDTFKLGGTSFAQTLNKIGTEVPTIKDATYFKTAFNVLQNLIKEGRIEAGHDVGSGGLVVTLLEMCFADVNLAANYDLSLLLENDSVKALFNENIAVVFQADASVEAVFAQHNIEIINIGSVIEGQVVHIKNNKDSFKFHVSELRDTWFKTSFLLDSRQSKNGMALERFTNYKNQPLKFHFPSNFDGKLPFIAKDSERPKAAIIREKGSNSEREMANAMFLAGFDVCWDLQWLPIIHGAGVNKSRASNSWKNAS